MKTKKLALAVGSLLAAFASNAATASISVACPTQNETEYRQLAEFAKSIGATHLDACQVEDSLWQWNGNRYDPYPNWSMHRPSIFKFIVPPELEKYIPADYAKRNLDNLKMRARVLKEYGFKSTFNGMEPAYFPEQAYLDHPEWRGSRCDQCRRARFEYYAPCVDNPEVRAFYVRTITELCKVCPFDRFELRSNDSGSAICWSPYLYPGKNGPESCRGKPYGRRVAEFLGMFQEGAAAAGLPDAKVNVRANLVPIDHQPSLLSQLRPGQSVNSVSTTGAAAKYAIGFPNRFNDYTAPVFGLARMGFIAEQLQKYQAAGNADLEIGLRSLDECDTMDLLRLYLKKPIGKGPEARWAALRTVAVGYVGEEKAIDLVQAWEALEEANKRLDPFNTGGHLFLLGSLHQRWITRPLVAFPGELKGEDRRYWREYIFQAQSEDDANNLLDLQANRWLSGYGGYRLLTMCIRKATPFVDRAIRTFKDLNGAAVDARAKAYLARQAARAAMYRALMINAQHVVEFQSILDRTDFEEEPEDPSPAIDEQGDKRLLKINQIVRAEIDNTLNMIRILDTGLPVFDLAPTPERQTIMVLGPGIKDDLKRKIAIMEAHRRDFLRLYKSQNW